MKEKMYVIMENAEDIRCPLGVYKTYDDAAKALKTFVDVGYTRPAIKDVGVDETTQTKHENQKELVLDYLINTFRLGFIGREEERSCNMMISESLTIEDLSMITHTIAEACVK